MYAHLKDNMAKIFNERTNLIKRLDSLQASSLTEKVL